MPSTERFTLVVFGRSYCPTAARQSSSSIAETCRVTERMVLDGGGVNDYRKLSQNRWLDVQPVLGSLLKTTHFVDVHYSWRPVSPDPGDDHVIDCAMNANAMVVTSNIRDFQLARQSLGLQVVSPLDFIVGLRK